MGVIQQSAINRSQVLVEFIEKRWVVLDVPRNRAKHQLMVKLIPQLLAIAKIVDARVRLILWMQMVITRPSNRDAAVFTHNLRTQSQLRSAKPS